MRDWGRDCTCPSGKDNTCGQRFSKQFGTLPFGYDHKYVYSHLGFNLKATDLQAAIGCSQIKKLDGFKAARQRNHELIYSRLKCLEDKLILPEKLPNSDPNWFGFLITCKTNSDRDKIVNYLESRGIQTRMLFSANIIRHPCFEHLVEGKDYRIVRTLSNTDKVMNNTFWIGVYPGLKKNDIERMTETVKEAMK